MEYKKPILTFPGGKELSKGFNFEVLLKKLEWSYYCLKKIK